MHYTIEEDMKEIIFATNNAHKLSEVQAILGEGVRLVTLRECGITEDIPENEPTLEGNALAKARYVHGRTGRDCFADDTRGSRSRRWGAPRGSTRRATPPTATTSRPTTACCCATWRGVPTAARTSARWWR